MDRKAWLLVSNEYIKTGWKNSEIVVPVEQDFGITECDRPDEFKRK